MDYIKSVTAIGNKLKNTVLQISDLEALVLDVTEGSGFPNRQDKLKIARSTDSSEDCRTIMDVIWRRINEGEKGPRNVLKALQLFEFLIANGSDRVIEDGKDNIYTLKTLKQFYLKDDNGNDKGKGIRELAEKIIDILLDEKQIKNITKRSKTE